MPISRLYYRAVYRLYLLWSEINQKLKWQLSRFISQKLDRKEASEEEHGSKTSDW